MEYNEKVKAYEKEIERAREEYGELESMFYGVGYSEAIESCTLHIFNIDGELFDGYYKSLTFTVYNNEGTCKLDEHVDIYEDSKEMCIFEGFKI